jgi:hypothetical protein
MKFGSGDDFGELFHVDRLDVNDVLNLYETKLPEKGNCD